MSGDHRRESSVHAERGSECCWLSQRGSECCWLSQRGSECYWLSQRGRPRLPAFWGVTEWEFCVRIVVC